MLQQVERPGFSRGITKVDPWRDATDPKVDALTKRIGVAPFVLMDVEAVEVDPAAASLALPAIAKEKCR